ncbi:MBL fold metallo-hydrolase [uncultured Mitsuokella sp.]|uniref:MBL fold metallo-hydrolase n=1 Tax=uncultured Mitsuokella sp. TaxID=453120 RepID=UPI0033900528
MTHGHFDHIGAVSELQETLKIPVYMGQKGRLYAENPVWNLSAQTDEPIVLSDVTYLEDHAIIALKEKPAFQLELLELPGHTADGVIYYTKADEAAFVGDPIFQGSYGRTDMYGGDEQALLRGIRERILTLPPKTLLLSGHSAPTTPADEQGRSWYQL